ncbi:hypothetical protein F5Y19DRAFT_468986 [Xylariaceae sp. FL1651]|nr:hypothetical protein F5Y19DRAFT_468986 [Xylariaceae sp. FL1651]
MEAATNRADFHRCSHFERLPNEIKLAVLVSLPDLESTINLALSGPEYYAVVAQLENELAARIALAAIGSDLMPFANAVCHANSDWRSPSQKIVDPTNNWRDYKSINDIRTVKKCLRLHKSIQYFARILARRAFQEAFTLVQKTPEPSSIELQRFVKSLYILQLVSIRFPLRRVSTDAATMRDYNITLAKFWVNFAPWEMQQVRCIQCLLGNHIQGVMDANSDNCFDYLDSSAPYVPRTVMAAFILDQGVEGLYVLEQHGHVQATRQALSSFQSEWLSSRRIDAYCQNHDALWLQCVTDNDLSLDAEHVFRIYPEEESGPMESWYHTLLQAHVEDPMFDYAASNQFKCQRCMTGSGYMFWDHNRLTHRARRPFPTVHQMRLASDGIVVSRDELFSKAWDRSSAAGCICDLPYY